MLGISFIHVFQMGQVILLSILAIVANFIARAGSLTLSTFLMGKLPDGFGKPGFVMLFTWGGLRGGLCVALAMSTKGIIPDETFYIILGGTYAIVFFTTVIQGLTMKPVYKRISRNVNK